MVYLLKMVIFHGYVSHNQMVSQMKHPSLILGLAGSPWREWIWARNKRFHRRTSSSGANWPMGKTENTPSSVYSWNQPCILEYVTFFPSYEAFLKWGYPHLSSVLIGLSIQLLETINWRSPIDGTPNVCPDSFAHPWHSIHSWDRTAQYLSPAGNSWTFYGQNWLEMPTVTKNILEFDNIAIPKKMPKSKTTEIE